MPDVETLLAHRPFVESVVRRLLRDEHLAEDVVQETWLAALKGAPPSLRSARAWLHRVARNLVQRAVRDRARREHREREGAAREGASGADALLGRLESHRQVVEAVSALEPAYRTVILLRFYEDLPPREIARRLNERPSTVRTRLQRALEMLRGRLDRAHGGDGRSYVLALLPLLHPPELTGTTHVVGGVLAMKKALACVALLVLGVAGWVAYSALAPRAATPRSEPAAGATASATDAPDIEAPAVVAEAPPPERSAQAPDPPADSICVGRVQLRDGAPLPGATLSIGNDPKLRGVTDAEGRLLVPGDWTESRELLLHAADGSWRMTTGAFARKGAEIEIALERGTSLAATVVAKEGGAPVAKAGVFLGREGLSIMPGQGQGVWASSDEQGRVRIEFLPAGRYRFEIAARGFEGVQGFIDVPREGFPDRIELAPGRMLTIRLEGLAKGFEGREVLGFVQRSGGGMPRRFREKLDERGEIRIDAPPTGSHGLVVEAGDVTPQLRTQIAITEGELSTVVLRVPPGASWSGTVRLADGAPWANRAIRIDSQRSGDAATVRTDERGFARVGVLSAGKKTVVAMIPGGWLSIGELDVPAQGTIERDLRLPGTAAVRARIVRGTAPTRMPIVLSHETDPALYAYQTPDGDGRVALDHLAPGSYTLETRGDSVAKLRTVVLRESETTDLGDLDLGAGASVAVEVVVPAGTKLPKGFHAYATIAVPGGGTREQVAIVFLDESGRGTVADLPPGSHSVRVNTPGFADVSVTITVPSAEPVRIVLEPGTPKDAAGR